MGGFSTAVDIRIWEMISFKEFENQFCNNNILHICYINNNTNNNTNNNSN